MKLHLLICILFFWAIEVTADVCKMMDEAEFRNIKDGCTEIHGIVSINKYAIENVTEQVKYFFLFELIA